jgi:hypothetical protein
MPFIIENTNIISFADYDDVYKRDQRLFDTNEGLTDDSVEDALIRATERILTRLRSSAWWRSYYTRRDSTLQINTVADVPALDPTRIIERQSDFTDLCIFVALAEIILPSIADFGSDDNAERNKMGYYNNKAESLFGELITAGDWYDFDGDGVIRTNEKQPGQFNLKRVR